MSHKLRIWAAAAALLASAATASSDEFKIGMVVPTSGVYGGAYYGPLFRMGIELGVEEMNKAGGLPAELSFVIEDGEASPEVASKATERVLLRDNVNIVTGELSSTATLAMIPIVTREKVPILALASLAKTITELGNPYVVRTQVHTGHMGVSMADLLVGKLGVKRIALAIQQNDFGKEIVESLKERLQELGVEPVFEEYIPATVQDFGPIASKLAAIDPPVDGIVNLVALPQAAPLLRAAAEQNIEAKWVGGTYLTAAMEEQAGAAAEGMYIQTLFDPNTPDEGGQDFVAKFKAKFDREPELFSAEAYEAVLVIADALKRGGVEPEGFLAALRSTSGVKGPMGTVTFDESGTSVYGPEGKRIYYFKITDGQRVLTDD